VAAPLVSKATVADLERLGDDVRAELIHGSIVPKATPRVEHSLTQAGIASFVRRRFHRVGGGRWPGGWMITTEIHVVYEPNEVFCHDVAGWRRERLSEPLSGWVRLRPDWVAEILSPAHEKRDLVDKLRVLHEHGVPHYWVLNAEEKILVVHRHQPDGYLVALTAGADEIVRAEPFGEVELRVGILFGDEDDE